MNERQFLALARSVVALIIYLRKPDRTKQEIAICYDHADVFVEQLKKRDKPEK